MVHGHRRVGGQRRVVCGVYEFRVGVVKLSYVPCSLFPGEAGGGKTKSCQKSAVKGPELPEETGYAKFPKWGDRSSSAVELRQYEYSSEMTIRGVFYIFGHFSDFSRGRGALMHLERR